LKSTARSIAVYEFKKVFPAGTSTEDHLMKPESFEKLTRLKNIVGQMSIADKVAFTTEVSGKLQPDMLKTSDGKHSFSE
jgi:hypothetical protein